MKIAWTVAVAAIIALGASGYGEASRLRGPAGASTSPQDSAYAIAPRFDVVQSFSEGRAAFRVGDYKSGKWGFIDKTGTVVVRADFGNVANFHEGLAAVRLGDEPPGKWGYIDEGGQLVVRPQFSEAQSFAEGLAAVRLGKWDVDSYQYIDRAEKIAIRTPFRVVGSFHEGLAAVDTDRTSGPIRAGYLNKSGKLVMDGYNDARGFSEGLAAVYVPDETASRGWMTDAWNRVLSFLSGGWLGDYGVKYHYT